MGWFAQLFGSGKSDEEREIEESCVQLFISVHGLSPKEARKMARDSIRTAKEDGEREGTASLPDNYGDILLSREATDREIGALLATRRAVGVTDEDIRSWWNRSDLQRRMVIISDDTFRVFMFTQFIAEGMKAEQAAAKVRKGFPMYGDPEDTSVTSGDDRPLPYELKSRVNHYIAGICLAG